ncbi:MAG TPA: phospholipase D-like domain-containing protein, partial [Gammaproteobacteria bacterium]|nr:phospholipase D-like domain-containing protein [Gammaproteobacteria bacterium]
HAKTMVIDGVWSTVGSANLDMRSFFHNDEVNVVILGSQFAGEMEALFQKDLQDSDEVSLEQWEQRPLWQRLKEGASRLFEYWM